MFKKIISTFNKKTLYKGALIVLTGSFLGNLASYLLHLVLGRILGPSEYGLLSSLISLSYYLSLPSAVLSLVIVKFISTKSDNQKWVGIFVKKIFERTFVFGLFLLGLFLSFFPYLRNLVKNNNFFVFLGLGLNSLFSLYSSVFISAVQGLKKFSRLAILSISSNWLRFFFSLTAALLGLKTSGVIYFMALSTLVFLIQSLLTFQKIINWHFFSIKNNFKYRFPESLKKYSLAVLLTNITLTSLLTADVILARYFLSPLEAGYYAALSTLARIVFFATSPISNVVFPLVADEKAKKEERIKTFLESIGLIFVVSVFCGFIFFLLPKQMVLILFGEKYLPASIYLPWFAVSLIIYSFIYQFINFFLSIFLVKGIIISFFFSILQIILISFFHRSILQIIRLNILNFSLLLFFLMIYFIKQKHPAPRLIIENEKQTSFHNRSRV